MTYRIEFFNPSSQSWLATSNDFEDCGQFETEAAAKKWIAEQNKYERSEGFPVTSFRVQPD